MHIELRPNERGFKEFESTLKAAREVTNQGMFRAMMSRNGRSIVQGQQILRRLDTMDQMYEFAWKTSSRIVMSAEDVELVSKLLGRDVGFARGFVVQVVMTVEEPTEGEIES